jgi:MerR family transcriptional regulator, redox-sensitive transcriptional activator SoxR
MAGRDLYSITEVGEATGLRSSALRYYERQGLITPAARVSGRRQYDPSVLQRLAAIALLQEVGFTVAEMRQLLEPSINEERWQAAAEQKLVEIDSHLTRVTAARELLVSALQCDCSGLESCGLVSARRSRHRKAVRGLSPVVFASSDFAKN